MAALHTSSTPWLPQDDYLLTYSIERGASLESLAKGAVAFSRKFTIKELQERWLSLLYDPAVSTEAAVRMSEIESAVAQSKSKNVETVLGIEKRKYESVRNLYYSRKRVCKEPLYQGDLSFLMDNSFANEGAANCLENVLENPLESNFGIEDSNFDSLYNLCGPDLGYDFFVDEHNTLEDQIDQNLTIDEQIHDMLRDPKTSEEACRSDEPLCNSKGKFSDCGTSYEHLRYSPSLPEEATWQTMENMLLSEMPNGVGSLANNIHIVDGFDITDDNDAGEGVSHLPTLLSNPMSFDDLRNPTSGTNGYGANMSDFNYTNGEEMQIIDERIDEVEETSFDGLHTLLLSTMDYVVDDEVCSVPGVSNIQSCAVNQASTSTATFDSSFPEYRNGVICCVLNTEDPEIPCNDDIFPSKRPTSGGHRKSQNKAIIPSSAKSPGSMNLEPKPMKKSHSTQSLDGNLNCAVNGSTEKHRGVNQYESINHNSRRTNNEYLDLYGYDVKKTGLMAESNQGQMNVAGINHEAQQIPSALDFVSPVLEEADNDVGSSEPEQFYDSDVDLPCFSDVESMILDLDLGPADQDPLCAQKIEKYQQEDAQMAIIRWVQNANSHMQRDMASHGAFAILFGQHVTHYIKKTEIFLGRATADVHVDIDLTREGYPHKISRRQACIKMGKDGTFTLKNLGRSPIYVKGEKITNGQCSDLLSDYLIEIRDMTFLFEVNQPRVKLYLDNADR